MSDHERLLDNAALAAHPEDFCDRCGRPNVVWNAPNALWNRVVRPKGEISADPMLCPTCFIRIAETVGFASAVWRVQLDLPGIRSAPEA